MTRKVFLLPLGIAFVGFLAGHVGAGEATVAGNVIPESTLEAHDEFVSCTEWLNCNPVSPNYTGVCCRSCTDRKGKKGWDCKRRSAKGKKPDALFARPIPAGEATVAGIVTCEGFLMAEDGQEYALAGSETKELQRIMGKQIEVKGTVNEKQGKVTIDVEAYTVMSSGNATLDEWSTACGAWANCSPLPPTYTGTCCRQCEDKEGRERWDCKAFSSREHFNLAEW